MCTYFFWGLRHKFVHFLFRLEVKEKDFNSFLERMFKHVVHFRVLPNIQWLSSTKDCSQDNKVLWMALSNNLQFFYCKTRNLQFESNSRVKNTTHRYLNRLIDSIPFLLAVALLQEILIASVGNTVRTKNNGCLWLLPS